MALLGQITIVGMGLIGGAMGMALRRKRVAQTVVGLSRSEGSVRAAIKRGAIDWGTTQPAKAVAAADIVVLATPVETLLAQGKLLARHMRNGSILTDVGSTKAVIVASLQDAMPPGVTFVGGHPIAGSEKKGIEAAYSELFDGAQCILTPTARTSQQTLAKVAQLWKRLSCRVLIMSPAQHDRALAGLSHLPHFVAACLMRSVDTRMLPKPPRSFLEMTRIAASDPALWDDIFLTNRTELLKAARQFERQWKQLRKALAKGDRTALYRYLTAAKKVSDCSV